MINQKHNKQKDDSPVFEEELDTKSPDAEAVASYLKEEKLDDPSLENEEESKDDDIVENEDQKQHETVKDPDDFRITLTTDPTFTKNTLDPIERLFVSVKDIDIPITDEDQALYLKATLNDKPVIFTIAMENGIRFECRSLSMYESELTFAALTEYTKAYPDTNSAFWDGLLQQYRIAMQIQSVNSIPREYLSYAYEANKRIDHAIHLYQESDRIVSKIQAPLYGLMVRALNVFQHKLTRLQEAAFNKDFWHPGETDY